MSYFYPNIRRVLRGLMVGGSLLLITPLWAQDFHFTQFYSAPIYLNPAFAGTSIQTRVATTYRNQWPSIPGAFVTYNTSIDHFADAYNSGIALMASHDRSGTGALSYTGVSAAYAYELRINRNITFRPALQAGVSNVHLDINRLTFGDQLARGGEGVQSIDPDRARFADGSAMYADFATGFLLMSREFWFGGAFHHINKPNYSLLERDARMPARFSFHGGYRFKPQKVSAFNNRQAVVAAFNYRAQALFDQLDIGFYYEYDPITVGFWYRGLPGIKQNEAEVINQDALALLLGYHINNLKIGYSYDLTISPLISHSGGAHEISLQMEWASKKKKKNKKRVIPCAKF